MGADVSHYNTFFIIQSRNQDIIQPISKFVTTYLNANNLLGNNPLRWLPMVSGKLLTVGFIGRGEKNNFAADG